MILSVRLQMFGELLDARGEQRYLDFRRPAVIGRPGIAADYFSFAGSLERHQVLTISLFLDLAVKPTRESGCGKE
jgi:hypothetical protein